MDCITIKLYEAETRVNPLPSPPCPPRRHRVERRAPEGDTFARVRAATITRRLAPGLVAIALAAGVLLLLDRPRGSLEPGAAGAAGPFRIDLLEYVNVLDVEDSEVGI